MADEVQLLKPKDSRPSTASLGKETFLNLITDQGTIRAYRLGKMALSKQQLLALSLLLQMPHQTLRSKAQVFFAAPLCM